MSADSELIVLHCFCFSYFSDRNLHSDHHDLLKKKGHTSWKYHKRHKRASTVYQGNTEHHVELMVVADSKMALFHGEDLQHYLFVLISIVSKNMEYYYVTMAYALALIANW